MSTFNKTLNRVLSVLVAISLTLPGYRSEAGSPGAAGQMIDAMYSAAASYNPMSFFSANDPKISDNKWVLYLFPDYFNSVAAGKTKKIDAKAAASGTSLEIQAKWLAMQPKIKKHDVSLEDIEKAMNMMRVQDFLNQTVAHAPELSQLVQAGRFDEAFKFASGYGLMRLMIEGMGVQMLSAGSYDLAKMKAYFQAASDNWSLVSSTPHPYDPMEWTGGGKVEERATKNFNSKKRNEYPDVAFYMGKEPSENWFEANVAPYLMMVVIAVATWGVGTVISGALSTTVAGTTTLIGTGTVLSTTTAAGVVSTTLAGTAFSVGTSALAGAVVGGIQGQNVGDALLGGILGGTVGSVLGGVNVLGSGASVTGNISNALSNVGINGVANTLISGVATGTVSGAILNGGDFNAAFVGAATSASVNAVSGAIINAGTKAPAAPTPISLTSIAGYQPTIGAIDFSSIQQPYYDFDSQTLSPIEITAQRIPVPTSTTASVSYNQSILNNPNLNSSFAVAGQNWSNNVATNIIGSSSTLNNTNGVNLNNSNLYNVGAVGVATGALALSSAALPASWTRGLSTELVTVYHGSPNAGITELLPNGGSIGGRAAARLEMNIELGASAEAIESARLSLAAERGVVFATLDPAQAARYGSNIYAIQIDRSLLNDATQLYGTERAAGELFIRGPVSPVGSVALDLSSHTALLSPTSLEGQAVAEGITSRFGQVSSAGAIDTAAAARSLTGAARFGLEGIVLDATYRVFGVFGDEFFNSSTALQNGALDKFVAPVGNTVVAIANNPTVSRVVASSSSTASIIMGLACSGPCARVAGAAGHVYETGMNTVTSYIRTLIRSSTAPSTQPVRPHGH